MVLKDIIQNACNDLHLVASESINIQNKTLFSELYDDFYAKFNNYADELEELEKLIEVRQVANETLSSLHERIDEDDNILWAGQPISFKQARLLAIQNYVATTWSLYDTMTKVIGKLVSIDSIADNSASFLRLPEHLLNINNKGHDVIGAKIHKIVQNSYGYPVLLSYMIRNMFMHDSSLILTSKIFISDDLHDDDRYKLKDNIFDNVTQRCNGRFDKSHSRRNNADWDNKDLMILLQYCEEEIDDILGILLKWSVLSVKSHAQLFLSRDR